MPRSRQRRRRKPKHLVDHVELVERSDSHWNCAPFGSGAGESRPRWRIESRRFEMARVQRDSELPQSTFDIERTL